MYRVLIGKGLAPPSPAAGVAASAAACDQDGGALSGGCDGAAQAAGGPLPLLQLPSPATGAPQQFLLAAGGLLEVNRVCHEYGAWLAGDRLLADGSCYLCTPVDPNYVLLALLDHQQEQQQAAAGGDGGGPAGMFQEASTLLCIDSWPGAAALEGLAAEALSLICDVKGSGEDSYYRLSDQKALAWMRCKVKQTLEGLRAAAPGSVAGLQGDDTTAYALGFVSEYLSPRRLAQLSASLGISATGISGATPVVRSAPGPAAAAPGTSAAAAGAAAAAAGGAAAGPEDASQPRDVKARKLDPKEAARRKQEEGRAEAKAARLAKQAEGTRKISSFFAAPAKKK